MRKCTFQVNKKKDDFKVIQENTFVYLIEKT